MVATDSIASSVTNLGAFFHEISSRFSNNRALTQILTNGRSAHLSYRKFEEHTLHFAAFLQLVCNLHEGDRMVLVLQNSIAFPIALAAAWRSGITVIPLSASLSEQEITSIVKETGASAIVGCRQRGDDLTHIQSRTGVSNIITAGPAELFPLFQRLSAHLRLSASGLFPHAPGSSIAFAKALADGKKAARKTTGHHSPSPETPALILFSESELSERKGVVISHASMLAQLRQIQSGINLPLQKGSETILAALPMHHHFSITVNFLLGFSLGANVINVQHLRNLDVLRIALQHDTVSAFFSTGHIFSMLAAENRISEELLRSLKIAVSGVSSINPRARVAWSKMTKAPLVQTYGLSEAGSIVATNLQKADSESFLATALPGVEIEVRGEENTTSSAQKSGRIFIRNNNAPHSDWRGGTLHPPTSQWVDTGDTGSLSHDNELHFLGKSSEVLHPAQSLALFPEEVEHCIEELETVRECAVTLVPSVEGAPRLHASIVPLNREQLPSHEDIRVQCRKGLEIHKIPASIDVVWSLPRNSTGRLLRAEIAAQTAERMRLYDLEMRLDDYRKKRAEESALSTPHRV